MDAVTLQPAAGAHGEFTGISDDSRAARIARQPSKEDSGPRFGARNESCHGDDGRATPSKTSSRTIAAWSIWKCSSEPRPKTLPG